MNKYTFYCGTGATLTVEAQTPEEALQKLYPKPGSFLGYYEQPVHDSQADSLAPERISQIVKK
jgi:hypothetical protein